MGEVSSGQYDLSKKLYYRLKHLSMAFDLSDAKYLVYWRGRQKNSGKWLWGETPDKYRDITALAKALGGAGGADGIIGTTPFSGRTLPGPASATVDLTNGKGLVTVAAKGGNAIRQRLYMSKMGTTTPFYLAAEGADGFAASGIEIGGTAYPITEANLFEVVPTFDASQTNGYASLGTPAAPTLANVAGGDAGTLTNGTHVVKLVNVAPMDTEEKGAIEHQFVVFNREMGEAEKFPSGTWELWNVGD